jgi:hypothetical protein
VGAIAVPLICGILAANLGQKAIRFMSALVEDVQLPF